MNVRPSQALHHRTVRTNINFPQAQVSTVQMEQKQCVIYLGME